MYINFNFKATRGSCVGTKKRPTYLLPVYKTSLSHSLIMRSSRDVLDMRDSLHTTNVGK